jgi:Fe-S-cluster containining protein
VNLSSQGYACLQCGKSCHSGWRVWLEPASQQRLEQHPVTAELRRSGYEPLILRDDDLACIAHRPDGRCPYLTPSERCSVHQTKPRTCLQFPYLLVETPSGCQVGLSFRCTAVQQNHQGDWDLATLERLRSTGSYPRVGFDPIPVRPGLTLNWDGYLLLERQLLERLDFWGLLGQFLRVEGDELRRRFQSVADPDTDVQRYLRHLVERKFLVDECLLGRLGLLALLAGSLVFARDIDWVEGELLLDTALHRRLAEQLLAVAELP